MAWSPEAKKERQKKQIAVERRAKHLAEELRAENERLRTALLRIEAYRAAAKSGSDAVDDSPWYALGRIATQASLALRGHADGSDAIGSPEGDVTNEEELDGSDL